MAVESFDFGEKLNIKGILIKYSNRILRIHCSDQLIPCIANSPQMAGRDISTYTDHCKIFLRHLFPLNQAITLSIRLQSDPVWSIANLNPGFNASQAQDINGLIISNNINLFDIFLF